MAGTDFSHLTTDELIKGIKALDLPDYIRTKAYGIDVRETLAQMTEMTIQLGVNMGLSPDDALLWARKLQEAVSQSEFDSWVATLLDGGPSIFMNTLSELQTTYPNGAAGVALVRETDPAKIYVWNGTAWEDFGNYQGIEIKNRSITSPKISDGAVTPEKTSFVDVEVGLNLFNKNSNDNESGKFIKDDGVFANNEAYLLSHLIEVKPNKIYATNITNVVGYSLLYSDDMTPTVVIGTDRITTNSDTKYMRVHMLKTQAESVMVHEYNGAEFPYEQYEEHYSIDNLTIKKLETGDILDGAITKDKTDFILTSSNLFDKSKVIKNKLVLTSDGSLADANTHVASDFIVVEPNQNYVFKHAPFSGWFYTIDKTPIHSTMASSVRAPKNARFFRMGIANGNVDTQQMCKGTILPEYEEYYAMLSDEISVGSNGSAVNSLDNKIRAKNRLHSLSDAVWAWKDGEKFPIAFMGDSTTDGATITGYTPNVIGTDDHEPNAYPYLLEQKLREYTNNETLRIYNAGFSGWHTQTALNNMEGIFGPNTPYADVKMIGFMYGINDRGLPLRTFKENLKKLILWCYDNGIQPFLVTPQMIVQTYSTGSQQSSNYLVSDITRAVKEIGELFGLEVIDNNTATDNFITNSKTEFKDVLSDILHFGDRGHLFESEYLFAKIIGDAIEITGDTFISPTNQKVRFYYSVDYVSTEPSTFRKYLGTTFLTVGSKILTCYLLNSSNTQLKLALDSSKLSNYHYDWNGVRCEGDQIVELEIGVHKIDVYLDNKDENSKFYGINIYKN